MRRFALFLLIIFFVLPFHLEASVSSGDLIKASGDAVYYLGADGKRYVFPTKKTYLTWYTDFLSVKTISDAELSTYIIGGNVTYRPGVKLVKITTDPKVYAVGSRGTLRWIETEAMAKILYGDDWAKKIDDIPDPFFINYKIGASISKAGDFIPASETSAASSINVEKEVTAIIVPQTPTPTSTQPVAPNPYSTTITSTNTTPAGGAMITLSATANPSGSLSQLKILINGSVLKTCPYNMCSVDYTVPLSNAIGTPEIKSEATWIDGHTEIATSTLQIQSSASANITLKIGEPEVRPNTYREAIVIVSNEFTARTIEIFVDQQLIKACDNLQECRLFDLETGAIGTTHTVYAIVKDALSLTRKSETKTISVVDNPRPLVTIASGKSWIYKGETVDITATASDASGLAWTEVWINGVRMKQCQASTCTFIAGPWNQTQTIEIMGKAQDILGLGATSTAATFRIQ